MKCPLCGKETQPGNNCSECGADISKYNKGGGLFGEGYTPTSTKISEPSDESKNKIRTQ